MSRTLWAAFYADGVLYGVTEDPRGSQATVRGRIGTASFWPGLYLDDEVDGFVVARLENVPDDVAEDLLTVGSRAQVIQDGYEAAGIAAEYWAEWTDWAGRPDLHAMDALVDGPEDLGAARATPRPWVIGGSLISNRQTPIAMVIRNGDGKTSDTDRLGVPGAVADANAALILRAVNAHDALVEALEAVDQAITESPEEAYRVLPEETRGLIDAALALARGDGR